MRRLGDPDAVRYINRTNRGIFDHCVAAGQEAVFAASLSPAGRAATPVYADGAGVPRPLYGDRLFQLGLALLDQLLNEGLPMFVSFHPSSLEVARACLS